MSKTQVAKTQEQNRAPARTGTETTTVLRPAVDVYEDETGITLLVDLPGVSRERLNIQVDNDTLMIDGEVAIEMSEGLEALHADVRATHFRRSFTLSRELETDKIDAQLKEGVLTLHIPKQAELRPRKIEVSVE